MAGRRLLLILLCGFILVPIKTKATKLTFLDVGQGDGIFLDAGETIMIDGGSSSKKTIGRDTIEPFLKSQRITCLDKVFLTHADEDHVSGIRYLGTDSDIRIKTLYLPWPAKGSEDYADVMGLADETVYLKAGDKISLKRGTLLCLSPYYDGENDIVSSQDMNEQSLVLLYTEGDFSALFMGDAGKSSEEIMLRHLSAWRDHFPKNITVFKVGHHGSDSSTSEALLEEMSPGIAVLSYGRFNRYNHPSPETVELLENYGIRHVDTADTGAITFELRRGNKLKMETFIR